MTGEKVKENQLRYYNGMDFRKHDEHVLKLTEDANSDVVKNETDYCLTGRKGKFLKIANIYSS